MWLNQDEMFADEKQREYQKEIDTRTISRLDNLAMRIADGDVSISHVSKKLDTDNLRDGVAIGNIPCKLEVTYHES